MFLPPQTASFDNIWVSKGYTSKKKVTWCLFSLKRHAVHVELLVRILRRPKECSVTTSESESASEDNADLMDNSRQS